MQQSQTLSLVQEKVARWTRSFGFHTEEEFPVGKYFLDIYIPELHAAVEVDGPVHSFRKDRDKARDQEIWQLSGIIIVRIKTTKVTKKNVEEVLKGLEKLALVDIAERMEIGYGKGRRDSNSDEGSSHGVGRR